MITAGKAVFSRHCRIANFCVLVKQTVNLYNCTKRPNPRATRGTGDKIFWGESVD